MRDSERPTRPGPVRVLSLLPVLGHPRDSKRIAMLQEAGCSVEAAAFERDYHSGRMPTCAVHRLGRISHGRYARRVLQILSALPTLRRLLRKSDLAYASGQDMALSALVAGIGLGKPLILEVGDIRRVEVLRNPLGWLVRRLERFVVARSKALVVTAAGFAAHFRDRLRTRTPLLVLENKLDAGAMSGLHAASALPSSGAPLRIGYFGVLRCAWSWEVLEKLAETYPNRVQVVVAGYAMEPTDIATRASRLPNVSFRGQYKSPGDLPNLYSEVDLVWACYPGPEVTDPDWRWALRVCRSNRFYESCYFARPLVSLAGSGDGDEVARYGIGLVIDDQSPPAVCAAVAAVSHDDLARWSANLTALPRSVYLYESEQERLRSAVERIARGEALET